MDDIFNKISSIYQSNSVGVNTETFCLGITSVKMPVGKGGNYNTFSEECAKRRGIIMISNSDSYCLPRLLVVAKAFVDKDPEYNKVCRDTGKIQTHRAVALMENAGVVIPEEGAGIIELQKFQRLLPNYRITVYQYGTKGRDVIFEGDGIGPSLNLLFHEGHFQHRCGGTCVGCLQSPTCLDNVVKIHFSARNRSFRGQMCFDNHSSHKICEKIRRCE